MAFSTAFVCYEGGFGGQASVSQSQTEKRHAWNGKERTSSSKMSMMRALFLDETVPSWLMGTSPSSLEMTTRTGSRAAEGQQNKQRLGQSMSHL